MTGWIEDTVSNLQARGILRVEDGNHGEYRPRAEEFCAEGVAFIRAADIADGAIDFVSASKINNLAHSRITKGLGKPGDILISHKGTVGKIGRAPANSPSFVCSPQTTFWRSTNDSVLNQDFLYVLIRSSAFMREFLVSSGETDMAGYVSLTSQRRLKVTIPPVWLQRTISSCILAFDDKIELNRKMNATLESMARALFRDWFVDFGPTRAKMQGRAPYLSPDLWSLFPDRLDDEGKPEGWEVSTIGEVIELLDHKRVPLSSQERAKRQGTYPYHGATSVMDHIDNFLFNERLLLLGEDGSVAHADGRPFTQYVWGKIWVNNHAHVIKGCKMSVEQLKLFFDQVDIRPFVTGAVQPKLNQANLRRVPHLRASNDIHSAFDAAIAALFDLIRHQHQESRTLAQTRDLLLPRLMSGELQVADLDAREMEPA